MFSIYRSEFLKLKRTKIYWAMLSLAVLGNFISVLFSGDIKNAFYQHGSLLIFLTPFVFALITGYIFSKEYNDRVINQLFTYPVSRIRIFIAKLIAIYSMIVITFVLSCLIVIAVGTAKVFTGDVTVELFMRGITMNLFACGLSFGTIPVAAAVVIVGKNIVPSMVLGAVASLVTTALKIGKQDLILVLFPWGTPYYMINVFNTDRFGQTGEISPYIGTGLIILSVTFLISLIFCLWYYNKSEIHSGA
jgi:ABC-type transport system involved in multi-copper enzyme maturation permease subunit